MNMIKASEIYKTAINHWGNDMQINQAVEEMAELIQAINKMRQQPSPDHLDNVDEEIADVEIMLDQLKLIYGITDQKIIEIKEKKLERLQKTLEKVKGMNV